MCHGGVFERALGPEHSHTHMCAAHSLHVLAPSRVCPSNSHDANILHPSHVVLHLLRVGCNKAKGSDGDNSRVDAFNGIWSEMSSSNQSSLVSTIMCDSKDEVNPDLVVSIWGI